MRRNLTLLAFILTVLLLLLATLTPLFKPFLIHLPPHTHLIFHFMAHLLFSLTLLRLTPPHIPAEAICLLSICLAMLLELVQALFIPHRSAQFVDLVVASLATTVVFVVPREPGAPLKRPSWNALMLYLFGNDDDDDDDDPHRVGSWAV